MRTPIPGAAPAGTVNVTEKVPLPSTVQSARLVPSNETSHGGKPGVNPAPSTVIDVTPAKPDVGLTLREGAARAGNGGVKRAASSPNTQIKARLRKVPISFRRH
jgi:hypothetical protein